MNNDSPHYAGFRVRLNALLWDVVVWLPAIGLIGERIDVLPEVAPSWNRPLSWAANIWFWSELLVLLTNQQRRALHDFLAGTVVIHAKASPMGSVR